MSNEHSTEGPSPRGKYKPGEVIEIEVDGYDAPFQFAVSLRAYQKLQRAEKKSFNVYAFNFLRETSLDWERLEPLLDEQSPDFDMTLQPVLLQELMTEIGLARETAAKKHLPSQMS